MWSKVLVVLAGVVAVTGSEEKGPSEKPMERIYGSFLANITNYPYQLSVLYLNRHTCGASIVSRNLAITATSCIITNPIPIFYKLRAGSNVHNTSGTLFTVKLIIPHPKWNATYKNYNIAMILINGNFSLGRPGIGKLNVSLVEMPVSLPAKIAGWGASITGGAYELSLRAAVVTVLPRKKCVAALGSDNFTTAMICTAPGKGFCPPGDVGSPLVVGVSTISFQIGIASWSQSCEASSTNLGVYTNTAHPDILAFIAAIMNQFS